MHKATIIFGTDAVRRYEETGDIPDYETLDATEGAVVRRDFSTKEARDAYMRALEDYDGYNKYIVADSEETPHSTTDARIKEMLRAEPWYGLFLLVGVQVLMDHIDDLPDDDLCGMFDSVFSAELIRETVPLIYNRMNGFPDGHQCQ